MSYPARGSTARLLWLVAALALFTGAAEAGWLAVREFALGGFIGRSRDTFWLAPLAYLLVYGLLALPLAGLHWRWPRLFSSARVLFAFVLVSGLSLLALFTGQKLHPAAAVLLAAGVAVQAARLVSAREVQLADWARPISRWLGALVLLVAAGIRGSAAWAEHRALTALPAASAGAPNVLLLILDTVRAESLSLYGYRRDTSPALTRWGARGVVFDHALATAPWTLPSHASIFTGRFPHELSAGWTTPLDAAYPTLAESLRSRGYRTGGFVANLLYTTREKGLARGFIHYEDYPLSLGTLGRSITLLRRLTDSRWLRRLAGTDELVDRRTAADIDGRFLEWQGQDTTRPFFAFLNYYDAHEPYLPPAEWYRRFAGRDRADRLSPLRRYELNTRRMKATAEDIRIEQDAYDASIAWLDDEIGRLLDGLERQGVLKNTIVIVASDHGEEFGEHGVFYHGHTLYLPALHVPLVVIYPPKVPAGTRVLRPVSLRDLAATIFDLTGQADPRFPGRSLAQEWNGGAPLAADTVLSEVEKGIRIPEWYPGSRGDMASLVTDSLHFICNGDGADELYDWARDPAERSPLPGGDSIRTGFRAALAQTLRAGGSATGWKPGCLSHE